MLYFFPGYLTKNNKGTHQNLRLSSYDVLYLNLMYPTTNMKNRLSPDEFYKKIYKESLNKSMNYIENVNISQKEKDNNIDIKRNAILKNTVKKDFTIPIIILSIILLFFVYIFANKN